MENPWGNNGCRAPYLLGCKMNEEKINELSEGMVLGIVQAYQENPGLAGLGQADQFSIIGNQIARAIEPHMPMIRDKIMEAVKPAIAALGAVVKREFDKKIPTIALIIGASLSAAIIVGVFISRPKKS